MNRKPWSLGEAGRKLSTTSQELLSMIVREVAGLMYFCTGKAQVQETK